MYQCQFAKFEIEENVIIFKSIIQFTLNQTYFDRNNY